MKILDILKPLNEHLTKVDGKWALVSKSTGKPLRYYKGKGKPSKAWVDKMEHEIQYFKHMHEGMQEPTPLFVAEDDDKIYHLGQYWQSVMDGGHYKSAVFVANSYAGTADKIDDLVKHFKGDHLRAMVANGYLSFENDLHNGQWEPVRRNFEGKPIKFQMPCDTKWRNDYSIMILFNNAERNFRIVNMGKVVPFSDQNQ